MAIANAIHDTTTNHAIQLTHKMRHTIFIIPLVVLLLTSCQRMAVYSDFHSLPPHGWHEDSILTYTMNDLDTSATYEIQILLRHTSQYPYQNLWLFVDEYAGNMHIQRDTIEAMLADDYGRWLGNGINRYALPLMYEADYHFISKDNSRLTIQQGMRTEWLTGITDVGIKVIKN